LLINKIFNAKPVLVDVDHVSVVDVKFSTDQNFDLAFSRVDEFDAAVALNVA
jgi:hypothetical protein